MQPVIAVDGYSSCGKSTFARLIAQELGYIYIDSGAMYRAVALYCLENGIISGESLDLELMQRSLGQISIQLKLNPGHGIQETWLNGRNVEEEIRSIAVSDVVSRISQVKTVREKMVSLQRKIGENGGVVMDGRDIGTIVFPEARLKIFMTADPDIRAKRRYDELVQKGVQVELSAVAQNVRMRDHEDENRKESPLVKARDAIVLDNSYMTLDQQMDWFRDKWKSSKKKHEG
ncbi:MAG TPA: (d)CMP kinase [Bacteroidales bacterium]|nr:(d)CMP kinase [Bacteroidales bacterium]